ncbi:MAG: pyrimidine dimer DNA glycosylase/endonuclease V [Dehalococcoidales bacterium]|nr:pyrimidine dimer DNA glycosylase/endonuclease V [Dehalococcoidales bacterium]
MNICIPSYHTRNLINLPQFLTGSDWVGKESKHIKLLDQQPPSIVKMWTGFENALRLYSNAMGTEWIRRGYRNNMEIYNLDDCKIVFPWWLGKYEFHASHRATLLAKDYGYYSKYGWSEAP